MNGDQQKEEISNLQKLLIGIKHCISMGFKIKQLWKQHRKDKKRVKRFQIDDEIEEAIKYIQPKKVESIETIFQEDENSKLNLSLEEMVLEFYENEISNLSVRESLKDYLRRTLHIIVRSKENEKIFILDIREQLKFQEKDGGSQQYSQFIQVVDKLYFLALDKSLLKISQAEPENLEQQLIIEEQQEQPVQEFRNSSYFLQLYHQRAIQHLTVSFRRRLGSLVAEADRFRISSNTEGSLFQNQQS